MRTVILALALLFCVSHARRLNAGTDNSQDDLEEDYKESQTLSDSDPLEDLDEERREAHTLVDHEPLEETMSSDVVDTHAAVCQWDLERVATLLVAISFLAVELQVHRIAISDMYQQNLELNAVAEKTMAFTWDITASLKARHYKKGDIMESKEFSRAGVSNMKLEFYPRGNLDASDGKCSLFLMAPAGWKLTYRLSVDHLVSREIEDLFDGDSWGLPDMCDQGRHSKVGVEILRAVPPPGYAKQQVASATDRSEQVRTLIDHARAVAGAAQQAEVERDWAIAALLRVQALDSDMLPRAMKIAPQTEHDATTLLRALRQVGSTLSAPLLDEFDPLELKLASIIGLETIKDQIRALRRKIHLDQHKRKIGAAVVDAGPLHMVFKGNPGSGKTMIARLLGELLLELGVVRGSAFVEVQRGDLVGQYVGHTAPQTREHINQAKGGILFVDEAYRLSNSGSSNDFGKEAIEEIMKDLPTGDPLVCLAGYPDEMYGFLETNPGLKRRFPLVFDFPDYSPRELAQIFVKKVQSAGLKFGIGVTIEAITELITDYTTAAWRSDRNGDIADKMFVAADQSLSARLPHDCTKEAAETFELLDIRYAAEGLMRRTRK